MSDYLFNKVSGLQPAILFKKESPVQVLLKNNSEGLLLHNFVLGYLLLLEQSKSNEFYWFDLVQNFSKNEMIPLTHRRTIFTFLETNNFILNTN